MKQLLAVTFVATVFSFTANAQLEQITCASPIAKSCKTENSVCYEYTNFDTDQAEAICENMDGIYQSGPCDKTDAVLRCMQAQNIYMPFWVFQKPMDRNEAENTCNSMGGVICE